MLPIHQRFREFVIKVTNLPVAKPEFLDRSAKSAVRLLIGKKVLVQQSINNVEKIQKKMQ